MNKSRTQTTDNDLAAWCKVLGLVYDEAKDAGEDFLAYLAGVALTHSRSLRNLDAYAGKPTGPGRLLDDAGS